MSLQQPVDEVITILMQNIQNNSLECNVRKKRNCNLLLNFTQIGKWTELQKHLILCERLACLESDRRQRSVAVRRSSPFLGARWACSYLLVPAPGVLQVSPWLKDTSPLGPRIAIFAGTCYMVNICKAWDFIVWYNFIQSSCFIA